MMSTYDEVFYGGRVHANAHVERISIIAKLFGIKSASIFACNVLEIGCGNGLHLLNMAMQLPNSRFIGIDVGAKHITEGKQLIEQLQLRNIHLQQMNVLEYEPTEEKFDYIICHGIFSWVSDQERNKILAICKHHLHPEGIAYISYNCFPGWHLNGMLRDMMNFHGSKMQTTSNKIAQARAMVQFVGEAVTDPDIPYSEFIKSNVAKVQMAPDDYIFHEYLEQQNQPFYLYEFCQLASTYQLQYLGDTDFASMNISNYTDQAQQTLESICQDLIDMEQYMDFLSGREFRSSLVMHNHQTVSRVVDITPFMNFLYSFSPFDGITAKQSLEPLLNSITIQGQSANEIPLYKEAISLLCEQHPKTLSLKQIVAQISNTISDVSEAPTLLANLFQVLLVRRRINVHLIQRRIPEQLPNKPLASPLARIQAKDRQLIPTLHNMMIQIEAEWEYDLIQYADGTRTIAELMQKLLQNHAPEMILQTTGVENSSTDIVQVIHEKLQNYRRQGVLVEADKIT